MTATHTAAEQCPSCGRPPRRPTSTEHEHRPTVLHVVVDVEQRACDDPFAWLPVLGPTSTLILDRLTRCDNAALDGGGTLANSYDPAALADALGVAPAALWRSCERLHRFGVAEFVSPDVLVVQRSTRPAPQHRRSSIR